MNRSQILNRVRPLSIVLAVFAAALFMPGCTNAKSPRVTSARDTSALVGAWRAKISFRDGPMGGVKDLEFLYAYNAGGTMTESSNYDEAAKSSPPAYGVWKQTGPGRFQTKFVFYMTRAPHAGEGSPAGTGWWPSGRGELSELISLSPDGKSYTSTITLAAFDEAGKPVANGGGTGTGAASRISF